MPLHQKETVRGNLLDDIYASADLSVCMPKYKIPDDEHDSRHAYSVVRDELMLDGNSRQNLAMFCSRELAWDFRISRVKSTNSSGHKFGLSPLGVSWVIWLTQCRPTARI